MYNMKINFMILIPKRGNFWNKLIFLFSLLLKSAVISIIQMAKVIFKQFSIFFPMDIVLHYVVLIFDVWFVFIPTLTFQISNFFKNSIGLNENYLFIKSILPV